MKKLTVILTVCIGCGCLTSRPTTQYAYTKKDQLFLNGSPFKGTKEEIFNHIHCDCDDQGSDSNRYHQPIEPTNIVVLRGYRNQLFGLGVYLQDKDQGWHRIIFKNFVDTTEKIPHIDKIKRPTEDGILVLFSDNTEELYLYDKANNIWYPKDGSSIIDTKQVRN